MKAAIYIRVSSEDQVDGYSLAAQERACKGYAKLHGWTVVKVYADEGVSGRTGERPGLQRSLQAARSKRIGALIIHKLDRLARNAEYGLRVINELQTWGVAFVSVSDNIDTHTPMGKLVLTMMLGVAEWYSNNLSTETLKGLQEKARRGLWVGPVPFGYEKRDGLLIVHERDARVVRWLFERYATGLHSYNRLADELNSDGYQFRDRVTGQYRPFGHESIRSILKNRAYLGYVSCSDEELPGAHQSLISQELWEQVQQARATRAACYLHARPQGKREPRAYEAYCAVCGAKMWRHKGGKGGQIEYYVCSNRSRRTCRSPSVPVAKVEAGLNGYKVVWISSEGIVKGE
ncbi:MAG: recombinase family protein [Chloroflexaceae bacterium]|nr:recombinase family protein [Chloroflexaceae bacterium]